VKYIWQNLGLAGISAPPMFLHKLGDGLEKTTALASRSLALAERRYSQQEREGLLIIYVIKKLFSLTVVFLRGYSIQTQK